jgi:DNA-binding response OmpR family regulator
LRRELRVASRQPPAPASRELRAASRDWNPMPRALVVEDEANLRDLVALHLTLNGLETDVTGDGHQALELFRAGGYDLVVLDLMLPGLDGLSICRAIRRDARNGDVPILMLTARREEADKVLGLESGADDYLTKPFGVQELVARVRALLRRAGTSRSATPGSPAAETDPLLDDLKHAPPVTVGGLQIDPARRRVRVNGRAVDLTAQEFDLLYLLASHPGIVFSRDALLRKVWGTDTHVTDRSADALVKRVRRKIEPGDGEPQFILTVWGVGYKFADV